MQLSLGEGVGGITGSGSVSLHKPAVNPRYINTLAMTFWANTSDSTRHSLCAIHFSHKFHPKLERFCPDSHAPSPIVTPYRTYHTCVTSFFILPPHVCICAPLLPLQMSTFMDWQGHDTCFGSYFIYNGILPTYGHPPNGHSSPSLLAMPSSPTAVPL